MPSSMATYTGERPGAQAIARLTLTSRLGTTTSFGRVRSWEMSAMLSSCSIAMMCGLPSQATPLLNVAGVALGMHPCAHRVDGLHLLILRKHMVYIPELATDWRIFPR